MIFAFFFLFIRHIHCSLNFLSAAQSHNEIEMSDKCLASILSVLWRVRFVTLLVNIYLAIYSILMCFCFPNFVEVVVNSTTMAAL